jgi:hypothetical protein
MVWAADDDHMTVLCGSSCGQFLDPSHERAGCVDHFGRLFLKLPLNLGCNAMSPNYSGFASLDLNGFLDGRHTFVSESLHFLWIMDQRTECPDGGTVRNGFFDHFNGTLNAKTKTVFVCE